MTKPNVQPASLSVALFRIVLVGVAATGFAAPRSAAQQMPGPFDMRPPIVDEGDTESRMRALTDLVISELEAAFLLGDTSSMVALVARARVPDDERGRAAGSGCSSIAEAARSLFRRIAPRALADAKRVRLEIAGVYINVRDTTAVVSGALTLPRPGVLQYAPIELRFGVVEERLQLRETVGVLIGLCNLERADRG